MPIMLKKLLTKIKAFLHKKETQESIINILQFARNVIAEYAILMLFNDLVNVVIK